MKYTKQEQALEVLKSCVHVGDTLFTILRHVSQSGMSRNISVLTKDMRDISYYVAVVLERPWAKDGSVKIGGCGMDMGFALVNSLSYKLYHEYICIGEKCGAAVHVNTPRTERDGKAEHRDGYAIRQKWI